MLQSRGGREGMDLLGANACFVVPEYLKRPVETRQLAEMVAGTANPCSSRRPWPLSERELLGPFFASRIGLAL